MNFTATHLPGAYVIELEPHHDERGSFARAWCEREFQRHGLATRFVQCNASFNKRKGTLRGLHYQLPPHQEVKLIRCTRGAVYDVIVDLRRDSPTYLQWLAVELTQDNGRMVYAPAGFAHGYQTLEDSSEVSYQVSAFYCPEASAGVRWDDPLLRIPWPIPDPTLSAKDRQLQDYVP